LFNIVIRFDYMRLDSWWRW